MSTLEISSDVENKLLSRREISCTFAGGSGFITRQAAAEAIGAKLSVEKDLVQVISLKGKFGNRDLLGRAYVFQNAAQAKKQLPPYFGIRRLSKEARKQAREEAKKAKAAAAVPGAAAAPKK